MRPFESKCEHCGKRFVSAVSNKKYCSAECKIAAYKMSRASKQIANCPICGKEFQTSHEHVYYCSKECYEKRDKKRHNYYIIEKLWSQFRGSPAYKNIINHGTPNEKTERCRGCVWGQNGVCVRPSCTRR